MRELKTPLDADETVMLAPQLCAYGASDTGRRRAHNEDRFICDPARGLFVVVDGVGGAAAGEVAAELACERISVGLAQTEGAAAERLRAAIVDANEAIFTQSQADPAHLGMACVLTAVMVERDQVTVGHVGDTRLYEVRPDAIFKVTRDHSLVGVQEDTGALTELEAMLHPRRNEILRDVGSEQHTPDDEGFIDIYQFPFTADTALLLCSDGLTDLVPSGAVHQAVAASAGHPERSVYTLLDLANKAGGQDNITVIVAEGAAFGQAVQAAQGEHVATEPVVAHAAAGSASENLTRWAAYLVLGLIGMTMLLIWLWVQAN